MMNIIHAYMHRSPLYVKHWNLDCLSLCIWGHITWYVLSSNSPVTDVLSFKAGHFAYMWVTSSSCGGMRVGYMYSFPTNTKPKSDRIFSGLFCKRRITELCSCRVYWEWMGEKKVAVQVCVPTTWMGISHSVSFVSITCVLSVVFSSGSGFSFSCSSQNLICANGLWLCLSILNLDWLKMYV